MLWLTLYGSKQCLFAVNIVIDELTGCNINHMAASSACLVSLLLDSAHFLHIDDTIKQNDIVLFILRKRAWYLLVPHNRGWRHGAVLIDLLIYQCQKLFDEISVVLPRITLKFATQAGVFVTISRRGDFPNPSAGYSSLLISSRRQGPVSS